MSSGEESSPSTTHSLTAPACPEVLADVRELLTRVWRSHPALTATDRQHFEGAVIDLVGRAVRPPAAPHRAPVTMTVLVSCDAQQLLADVRDDAAERHHWQVACPRSG